MPQVGCKPQARENTITPLSSLPLAVVAMVVVLAMMSPELIMLLILVLGTDGGRGIAGITVARCSVVMASRTACQQKELRAAGVSAHRSHAKAGRARNSSIERVRAAKRPCWPSGFLRGCCFASDVHNDSAVEGMLATGLQLRLTRQQAHVLHTWRETYTGSALGPHTVLRAGAATLGAAHSVGRHMLHNWRSG